MRFRRRSYRRIGRIRRRGFRMRRRGSPRRIGYRL